MNNRKAYYAERFNCVAECVRYYSELSDTQRQHVTAMFDQEYSDKPGAYVYMIGHSDNVIARRAKLPHDNGGTDGNQ